MRTNTLVYLGLLILLALSTGLSYVHLGPWAPFLSQGIAVLKTALVAVFFMHLRHSGRLVRLLASGTLLWLLLLFGLTLSDYYTRLP